MAEAKKIMKVLMHKGSVQLVAMRKTVKKNQKVQFTEKEWNALPYYLQKLFVDSNDEPTKADASYPDGLPDKGWKNAEISAYLKDLGVDHDSDAKKADLLDQVPAE